MTTARAPMLTVAGVSVSFGGVQALDAVDLEVCAGEIVGLIGPNGAGKTTFIDAVTGFTPVTTGRVALDGVPVERLTADQRARRGLVRTFQSAETFAPLTVAQHVLAAAPFGFRSAIRSLLRPGRIEGSHVDAILRQVGLQAAGDQFPEDLSYGQRKLVDLARALAAEPRALLLDEPAAGLDTEETVTMGRILQGLRDRGLALLLVDHDMDLVLDVCDRVHVLDFGRTIASAPPAEIRRNQRVIDAYLGAPV